MPRIVLKDLETEKTQSVAELEATIGRDPASAIVIEGPKSKVVSGRHARIFFQDSAWWIEDSSRNGTILDNERLQAGQRHALRVGQVVGLGESGPRLRVMVLETRKVAETVVEQPDLDRGEAPKGTTAPRQPHAHQPPPPVVEPDYPDNTTAIRRSDAIRAGVRFEEPTEPMSPSPDWQVEVVLRGTNSSQRYNVTALVVKIGRAPECNVQIPPELGASVSRMHAEIAIEEGGVVVRDAGSRNGTFVNGARIDASHQVAKGDAIMLGSGGPTFAIEDLHIVKGTTPSGPPSGGGGGGGEPTPPSAKPVQRDRLPEPATEPTPPSKGAKSAAADVARRSFSGIGRTAFFKDVLEDVSQQSARRMRYMVWASVATAVIVFAGLLGLTQMRATAREDLRASARQTGGMDQAIIGARESLAAQLASGDSMQLDAEQVVASLRDAIGQSANGNGAKGPLDSLRRTLQAAEDRAEEIANRVRVVRESNLAQVAQLNQGAVGLLVSFNGERVVSGSGFAITPSGYFVTNRQVVVDDGGKARDSIYVTMADERLSLARPIQVVSLGTRDLDIAIVKIPGYQGPYVKSVDWNASGANQGEAAALIGFRYGVELARNDSSSNVVRTTLSAGIFGKVAPDRIQFDGFRVGSSSGSPIFNSGGVVVAVHRAGLSSGPASGYSTPVSRVVSLLPAEARGELGIR